MSAEQIRALLPAPVAEALLAEATRRGVTPGDLLGEYASAGVERDRRKTAGRQVVTCYECPRELRAPAPLPTRSQLRDWAAERGWTVRADPLSGWPHDLCPDHAHLAPGVERW